MQLETGIGLASLFLLLCAFYGLGLGFFRVLGVHATPLDGIYAVSAGWGVAVTISILATYLAVPLRLSLYAGLIAGCCNLVLSVWQGRGWVQLRSTGVALLSVLPAIISGASFSSVQYDEFSQWLPNAFYLYANDALPTAAFPNQQTGKQAYPIGLPYVSFAISAIEGTWDDRTAKVLPLALAALFSPLVAGVWLRTDRPSASATAVAALVTTLLNPFFDPRVAITTYSDVPTAFLVAAMVYALWRATNDTEEGRSWIVRASLTALTLVQLRETNVGLVLAAAFAVPLATMLAPPHDGRGAGLRRSRTIAVAFVVAPLAAFLIWRMHLNVQHIQPDMVPRVLSEWNWSAPKVVLASLLTERLANNPLAGVTAISVGLGLTIAGILAWHRSGVDTKQLVIHVAMLTIAQVALLVFSYVAVFTEDEVKRAASAWRYASHLGPLFILAFAQILPWERVTRAKRLWPVAIGARFSPHFIVGVVVAAQLLFVGRWRIDCAYPHVRPGYEALMYFFAKMPSQASITVVNAADSLLFGNAARLARVVVTRDWRTQRVDIVDRGDVVPTSEYVIDLTGADPELFRKGQTTLHATMHRDRLATSPIDAVSIATSCQAPNH
jgi:hypothetical protein